VAGIIVLPWTGAFVRHRHSRLHVYGGLVFIRGAWSELADHQPGMMTLISLALIVAFGTSLAARLSQNLSRNMATECPA
jgi:cation transport ATPase